MFFFSFFWVRLMSWVAGEAGPRVVECAGRSRPEGGGWSGRLLLPGEGVPVLGGQGEPPATQDHQSG